MLRMQYHQGIVHLNIYQRKIRLINSNLEYIYYIFEDLNIQDNFQNISCIHIQLIGNIRFRKISHIYHLVKYILVYILYKCFHYHKFDNLLDMICIYHQPRSIRFRMVEYI